jgi:predicted ATPase
MAAALADCEATDQLWCYAELWRVRGELLLAGSPADHAQAARCFERALSDARQRGARAWEMRAAVSLSRLLKSLGQRTSALEVLAPVYGGFTEGFDAVDLIEARALLSELGPEIHH